MSYIGGGASTVIAQPANGLPPRLFGGGGTSPLLTGLVHYWTLNEASGTRADSVGSATLADNNTVGSTTGVNSTAASFIRANSEYLSVARPTELTAGAELTISLWANWTSGQSCLFALADATLTTDGNPQLFIGVSDTGKYKFWCASTYSSEPTAATTGWHHWVFTSSGTAQSLYVDNTLVASRSGTILQTKTNLYIGQGYWGYWDGPIDEVGIWTRVLSGAELTTLYNSGAGKFYPSF